MSPYHKQFWYITNNSGSDQSGFQWKKRIDSFSGQYSLTSKVLSTATFVVELTLGERWVWTLKFVKRFSNWVFLDYQDLNATIKPINFKSMSWKKNSKTAYIRLKPWSKNLGQQTQKNVRWNFAKMLKVSAVLRHFLTIEKLTQGTISISF